MGAIKKKLEMAPDCFSIFPLEAKACDQDEFRRKAAGGIPFPIAFL